MKNIQDQDIKLQNRTAHTIKTNTAAEVSKYIIIQLSDREQVVAFSQEIKHVEAFDCVKRQHPTAKAISAGFYLYDDGALWAGGQSDTLNLVSRNVDHELVREFLTNGDRYQWQLTTTN